MQTVWKMQLIHGHGENNLILYILKYLRTDLYSI